MSADPCASCSRGLGCSACGAILTTDPVALAASLPAEVMLAALVDRGTLTEEDEVEWCDVRCPVWSISSDARCSHSCRRSGPHDEHECVDGHTFPYGRFDGPKPTRSRRFVTPWEVAE